jgi:hypothetical protein
VVGVSEASYEISEASSTMAIASARDPLTSGVDVNIRQMVIAQPSSIQQFSLQRKRFGPYISGVGRLIAAT